MLARAVYLRKAVEHFVSDADDKLLKYKLSAREWEMAELLVTILLPFKTASTTLQSTTRPSIDRVFWTYEILFNKIDKLKSTFCLPTYSHRAWVHELHVAVDNMASKLRKYYDQTDKPYVYSDGVILEPCGKLLLFKQQTWEPHLAEQYRKDARDRYIKNYESSNNSPTPSPNPQSRKRKFDQLEGDDDYRAALEQLAASEVSQNEFDRYMNQPPDLGIGTLEWWQQHQSLFPRLSMMARDTFAVPATGAGVERQFSLSARVTTWGRALLKPETICETMRYKDYLNRTGQPLTRNKRRNEDTLGQIGNVEADTIDSMLDIDIDDFVEDSGEGDSGRVIVEWEKEWWQKADARLVT